jgi:hypothetical protein
VLPGVILAEIRADDKRFSEKTGLIFDYAACGLPNLYATPQAA